MIDAHSHPCANDIIGRNYAAEGRQAAQGIGPCRRSPCRRAVMCGEGDGEGGR